MLHLHALNMHALHTRGMVCSLPIMFCPYAYYLYSRQEQGAPDLGTILSHIRDLFTANKPAYATGRASTSEAQDQPHFVRLFAGHHTYQLKPSDMTTIIIRTASTEHTSQCSTPAWGRFQKSALLAQAEWWLQLPQLPPHPHQSLAPHPRPHLHPSFPAPQPPDTANGLV